jgi:hypothetical protein
MQSLYIKYFNPFLKYLRGILFKHLQKAEPRFFAFDISFQQGVFGASEIGEKTPVSRSDKKEGEEARQPFPVSDIPGQLSLSWRSIVQQPGHGDHSWSTF